MIDPTLGPFGAAISSVPEHLMDTLYGPDDPHQLGPYPGSSTLFKRSTTTAPPEIRSIRDVTPIAALQTPSASRTVPGPFPSPSKHHFSSPRKGKTTNYGARGGKEKPRVKRSGRQAQKDKVVKVITDPTRRKAALDRIRHKCEVTVSLCRLVRGSNVDLRLIRPSFAPSFVLRWLGRPSN